MIRYHSLVPSIKMEADLSALPARDQVNLMQELMRALGITERFIQEPAETQRAREIMAEQWAKAWEGK